MRKSQIFNYGGVMAFIQSISEITGLQPLVIELVFLLLLAFVVTVVALLVLAIFRIKLIYPLCCGEIDSLAHKERKYIR